MIPKKRKHKSGPRKFTLRDNEGVLDQAEKIIEKEFRKPSLNTWIIEAIKHYNQSKKS